ncbi:MAG: hypothetical protein XD75_0280 [Parcubacteria bacterium 33_209]|nr:MAG: hypothetical protein XD75_0280 [Parcubacteria bacterium 33_209]
MSIENPYKNDENKKKRFEELKKLGKERGLPDKIVENMTEHHKDVVIEIPKGYDSKKRIEKIIKQHRIEKENN